MSEHNEKSLANLNPPKKGEIRNPNGRKGKDSRITKILSDKLFNDPNNGDELANRLVNVLIENAIKGNNEALSRIFDIVGKD